MAVVTEVRIIGTKRLILALARIQRAIGTGSSSAIGQRLAAEGLEYVKRLTPVNRYSASRLPGSRRGFQPLRDQWTLIEELTSDTAYRALLYNRARDTLGGHIVLASVEYGAKAHLIHARTAKRLAWRRVARRRMFLGRSSPLTTGDPLGDTVDSYRTRRSRRGDATVFAKSVRHPGHEGFHMVEETRQHLRRVSDELLIQFQARIEAIFGGISISAE